MPRFPGAWKGRIADDELFNDDEDFSMLRKRRKVDKEGSAEWERVCIKLSRKPVKVMIERYGTLMQLSMFLLKYPQNTVLCDWFRFGSVFQNDYRIFFVIGGTEFTKCQLQLKSFTGSTLPAEL